MKLTLSEIPPPQSQLISSGTTHKGRYPTKKYKDWQMVCGLVVNRGVNLPRETRRRLRAIEHHLATGRRATLTAEQLTGWRALQAMIYKQTTG